jgi:hypothetical protein
MSVFELTRLEFAPCRNDMACLQATKEKRRQIRMVAETVLNIQLRTAYKCDPTARWADSNPPQRNNAVSGVYLRQFGTVVFCWSPEKI